MRIILLLLFLSFLFTDPILVGKLPVKVENNQEGAPVTLGIPFPKGELYSPDHVRLLNADGEELECQTTKVNTWEPADSSIKWLWVFFFTEKGSDYTLDYGPDIVPMKPKQRIVSSNNMRPRGGVWVNTGPLYLTIDKKGDGFLDKVMLDTNNDGAFTDDEILAHSASENRGTFFDLLDDNGVDSSRAVVHEVFREEGSGPLHSIFRIEGTYVYNREENNPSPYTIYLHTYAGKSYVKVLHTLTYTGVPDKHKPQVGGARQYSYPE